MFVKIADFTWIQNTAVESFVVEEYGTDDFRVIFGMHNGDHCESKIFKTAKEAEHFAHSILSFRLGGDK